MKKTAILVFLFLSACNNSSEPMFVKCLDGDGEIVAQSTIENDWRYSYDSMHYLNRSNGARFLPPGNATCKIYLAPKKSAVQ